MSVVLSIDIGIKNLGWALLNVDTEKKVVKDIDFGIYVIDGSKRSKESTVSYRCKRINNFFKMFEDKQLDYIVIERQVNNNTQAMCLMYAIMMHCLSVVSEDRIFVFDPKLKFTFYKEEYCTKNKVHKKQSVLRARHLLENWFNDMSDKFEEFDKKDDISDAINQAITYLEMNNIVSGWWHDDLKNDDLKNDNLKNDNLKNDNLKNDDLKNEDLKNDNLKNDVENDDLKNEDEDKSK